MNAWLAKIGIGRALLSVTMALATSLSMVFAFPLACRAELREPFSVSAAAWELPDGVYLFGESTTAHLSRTGGVLDGAGRESVLRDRSGTRLLDRRILASPVECGGEVVPFSAALERLQPRVLVLSFGLNGLLRFSASYEAFLADYRALIEGVRRISPDTRILLQSVYPVGQNEVFSADVDALNATIAELNARISTLADGVAYVRYLDTAALLRDCDGRLCAAFDLGDGIHLTNDAYRVLLPRICSACNEWLSEVAE
jgi:hypothetical protein